MKFTLIAAVSVLSTLVSGLALPNLVPRSTVFQPNVAVVIKEDFPTTSFPTTTAEVGRSNGQHNMKTLLAFVIPPCSGTCTVSFDGASSATGSQRMQFFTLGYPPSAGNTWNSKPYTDIHKGTFQTAGSSTGTVVEDFGLTFNCPSVITNYGFEVQPVWDNDYVTWDTTTAGYIITCP
ncbi:hypothetical protein B9Z19DRAFT_972524 [Tuber borchii]|uniref:Uncharacterized protein n=1 Tax=Tuber borchii TaxID=42251 RepID=A0A2T7A033_TUBBO|nr:hypothetical protein B9Z19DRAFT_972524 [Tuber borchii]